MNISLIVLGAGKSAGRVVPVGRDPFAIGRDPRCNLRPASQQIAERHCTIFVEGERAFVRDIGGGTFVNGRPVCGETAVANGDVLKVGPLEFLMAIEGAAAPAKHLDLEATAHDIAAAVLLESSFNAPGLGDTLIPGVIQPSPAAEMRRRGTVGNAQDAASAILDQFSKRKR